MPFKMLNVEEEYKKNKELDKDTVKALQEWANNQPHLPKLTELQIILFLHSCYFSTQVTKDTIDIFYTVRTHCPEYFSKQNPVPLLKTGADTCLFWLLPQTTPEGYRILYCRLMQPEPSKYVFNEQFKLFDMVMMSWLHQYGTDNGLFILYDLSLVTLSHLGRLSLLGLKKLFYYLQEALPVRLKGLHFINVVPFMDKLMAMMKPFIKQELMDMLILHTESIDTLYKYVPKDCLPKDLGGLAPSTYELRESMKKMITETADFYKEEEKLIVDESNRPGKPKDVGTIFGIEGSFKKLDLD